MEEHGMFIETDVAENERARHEKFLRAAIKVSRWMLDVLITYVHIFLS